MDDEALKLENQLCFPLYACAREIVRLYKPILDELGLTYTQYIAMLVLWERQRATVKELCEALHLDSGTLTPLQKRLAAMGLITRRRDTADERSVIVELTEQGRALKERARNVPARILQCVPLNLDDAATLYRLLYQLLGQMERKEEA